MPPALILSSDSHVFEPPDLWTTRIDKAFRHRAPRMVRIDGADQLVVEEHDILSGIGLISNAGARFEAPETTKRFTACPPPAAVVVYAVTASIARTALFVIGRRAGHFSSPVRRNLSQV